MTTLAEIQQNMTGTSLRASLQEVKNKIDAARKEALEIGRKAFAEEAAGIFEKYPQMPFYVWTQYTPYFNDGDPCNFSVDNWYMESYWDEVLEDAAESLGGEYDDAKPIEYPKEFCDEFGDLLSVIGDDNLELMFGEGRITARRDGTVAVDDHEHD